MDGTRLLTDPILRKRVGPLVRHGPVPGPATTAAIDAVLISHLHHDHTDLASLRRLDRGTRLIVQAGSRRFFEHHGFRDPTELAPGESAQVGAVTVTGVEADHDGGKRRFAEDAPAIGYHLAGRRRVYFAGDTDYFPGMENLDSNLDLALLPIWGWGPNIGIGHLDPVGAARAAAALSPRVAVPIHWGTLYPFGLRRLREGPLRRPPEKFAAAVRDLAPQVEARVLSPGESTPLA